MRSLSTPSPAIQPRRRDRRSAMTRRDRRSAIIAAGLALGLFATAGVATAPASSAEASASSQSSAFGSPSIALASFATSAPAMASVAAESDSASGEAREALTAADATKAAALVLAADIEATGLDLGQPDTSIDTAELEATVERLSGANSAATPFLPYLTDELNGLVDSVDGRVSELRRLLDEAKARKAAEEAAEKARLEAEAAAAAAAAAAEAEAAKAAAAKASAPARSSGGGAAPMPVATGGGDNSPAGAQATARSMAAANYGWGDDQFSSCLVPLWNKESGWNYRAYNASSGAFGIPQALPGSKMASAGADWQTNAATQVAWGLGYIAGRYGTPCGAWAHSQSVGWY
ncbi:hypothetical protein ACPW96_08005 [Micromonospora sp. DT81.3]|uniref:aggregation-promoting factor C-terminal-like domain-containing protein n=1 Tax=Micromonospora sp. DT81.3 TaxID=3416523 RepID=UPI003CF93DFF